MSQYILKCIHFKNMPLHADNLTSRKKSSRVSPPSTYGDLQRAILRNATRAPKPLAFQDT